MNVFNVNKLNNCRQKYTEL